MNNYFKSLKKIDILQGYAPENVFILSDLHLFHTNVIKYVERPFEFTALGCKEMNEYLLSQFENLPENCLVWNLGDVLLNRHVSEGKAMSTIWRTKKNRKLNLILGNHDFQCDKGKHDNYIDYFSSLGFDGIKKTHSLDRNYGSHCNEGNATERIGHNVTAKRVGHRIG